MLSALVWTMPTEILDLCKEQRGDKSWRGIMATMLLATRREFGDKSDSFVRAFHRHAGEKMEFKSFVKTFSDCSVCMRTLTQKPRTVENGCFAYVYGNFGDPVTAENATRMARFVTTIFASPSQSVGELPPPLRFILAQITLVVRGEILPDILVIAFGDGGDSKSLLFASLLKATMGTGHFVVSSRNLQV